MHTTNPLSKFPEIINFHVKKSTGTALFPSGGLCSFMSQLLITTCYFIIHCLDWSIKESYLGSKTKLQKAM